jgi:alginate O-acetyltransferase complex protein AlgI
VQFNSYSYLLSLAVVVALFWLLPVGLRRGFVLLVSIAFYATWNPLLVALPLGIGIAAWICARGFLGNPDSPQARRWLRAGVCTVVLVLVVAKYRGFVIGNLAALIPSLRAPEILAQVVLPLGISFYSFEAVSFLLDVRQRRITNPRLTDLMLFVMFWPHLIAGPIVRFRELVGQLRFDRPFNARDFNAGLGRLIVGLVQKNVLADSLGGWVDDGFLPKAVGLNTSLDNWALAVAFGLQIYFDFSAYSNMAIGAARMIGVTLPENFRFPYLASTPPEFWGRWHMTLSRWIRDYLFFPLNAGYRNDRRKLYLSLIAVMGVVGLWHGAGWGFVAWGLMHGVYLVAFRATVGDTLEGRGVWLRLLWRGLTLVGITAAWVPFRASSLSAALTMLKSMFLSLSVGLSYSINFYLITAACCCVCVCEPWLSRILASPDGTEDAAPHGALRRYVLRPVVYSFLLLLFVAFDDRSTQFIYFQF